MPAILGGLLNSWADQEDDSRLTDSTCSATPGRPAMIAANATAETDVSKLSAAASSARCTPAGRLTLTRDRSVTLWPLSFSAASSTFPPVLLRGGGIDARARRSPIGNRSDTVLRLPTFVPCLPHLVPPVIPIRVIDTSTLPTSGAGVKRRRGRHEPGGDEATPRLRPRAYRWERRSREASLFPSPAWQTPAGLPGRLNGLKTPLTEHALAAGRLPAHAAAGTHTPRLHRAQPVS